MFSYHRSWCEHAVQCDRGVESDSSRGQRYVSTLKNDPIAMPNRAAAVAQNQSGVALIEPGVPPTARMRADVRCSPFLMVIGIHPVRLNNPQMIQARRSGPE